MPLLVQCRQLFDGLKRAEPSQILLALPRILHVHASDVNDRQGGRGWTNGKARSSVVLRAECVLVGSFLAPFD